LLAALASGLLLLAGLLHAAPALLPALSRLLTALVLTTLAALTAALLTALVLILIRYLVLLQTRDVSRVSTTPNLA
jgi:hypothetical protein